MQSNLAMAPAMIVVSALLSGFGVCTQARGQAAARFAIVEIGNIGFSYSATPRAINNNGVVVGDTFDISIGRVRSFVWRDGVVEFLPPLTEGFSATAYDVNEEGEATGVSYVQMSVQHAVKWLADGTAIDMGTLGGEDSFGWDISDSGQIAGSSDRPDGVRHPCLWEDGQMIDLGDLGRPSGGAKAINESRQLVGVSGIQPLSSRAFLWEDGQMINLGTLPNGSFSIAEDINNGGLIAGYATASTGERQAVVWENRVIRSIHRSSIGYESHAYAINSVNQIVGYLDVDGEFDHISGFLYEGAGPMVDLLTVLPPRHTWRQLLAPLDINDRGEIVAYGDRIGGLNQEYTAVLITPVHPTLTLQGPQPGNAGTVNGMRVTGCTPGERIAFFYSTTGGGTLVPGCNHTDGVTLQLDDPIQIGTAVANQNGVATLTRFVPTAARNLGGVLIQAVQQNGCAISQLVVHEFE